jgi:orotate phosphoribosyltransferase
MTAPISLRGVAVARIAGRHQLVGDLEALLAAGEGARSVGLVALGARGLTAGMNLATGLGASLSFVRSNQKSHGAGRVIDGAHLPDEPPLVVCHADDLHLADLLPRRPRRTLILGEATGLSAAAWPTGFLVPDAPPLKLRQQVDYLQGQFVTSSGREVQTYVETLQAAFTFDVAREFAGRLDVGDLTGFCAIAHGGALAAAVLAALHGRVADLFLVQTADRSIEFESPVCFVDDYVGEGNAARAACLALPASARASSHFWAMYGFVPQVDFGENRVRVLTPLERPT